MLSVLVTFDDFEELVFLGVWSRKMRFHGMNWAVEAVSSLSNREGGNGIGVDSFESNFIEKSDDEFTALIIRNLPARLKFSKIYSNQTTFFYVSNKSH